MRGWMVGPGENRAAQRLVGLGLEDVGGREKTTRGQDDLANQAKKTMAATD